jgi:hypothetical protein
LFLTFMSEGDCSIRVLYTVKLAAGC